MCVASFIRKPTAILPASSRSLAMASATSFSFFVTGDILRVVRAPVQFTCSGDGTVGREHKVVQVADTRGYRHAVIPGVGGTGQGEVSAERKRQARWPRVRRVLCVSWEDLLR